MAASCRPSCPCEIAPIGYTRAARAAAPCARTKPTPAGSSTTGSVLGIAQIAVKPPAAAARAPVAIVSLCSPPGSRRWTWRSMRPGVTSSPVASITRAPSGASSPSATADTRPSTISTSLVPSKFRLGSKTRPPLISSGALIPRHSPWRPRPYRAHRRRANRAPPCGRLPRWSPARE